MYVQFRSRFQTAQIRVGPTGDEPGCSDHITGAMQNPGGDADPALLRSVLRLRSRADTLRNTLKVCWPADCFRRRKVPLARPPSARGSGSVFAPARPLAPPDRR
jgi:hypothetical protein